MLGANATYDKTKSSVLAIQVFTPEIWNSRIDVYTW